MKKVFLIDPYYADSHRYWATLIANNLKADVRIFQKSAVHWKWKMEGAAIEIAKEINELDEVPDAFLVTDYLNLGLFKSLLHPKFIQSRFVVYMHENQLSYPVSLKDSDQIHKRDNHYGFINYTTCLVADAVAFNSRYHFDSFIGALRSLSRKLPEEIDISIIENKSSIIPSTITLNVLEEHKSKSHSTKNIVWNHRWDYDKRPSIFLEAMVELKNEGVLFNLILLGKIDQQTTNNLKPHLDNLKDRIIHLGYADSKEKYYQLLSQGDIVVSTSIHDFFGISVLEGMYAGCRPVLPDDLAYPELVEPSLHGYTFYQRPDLINQLKTALSENWSMENKLLQRDYINKRFVWESVALKYEEILFH